MKETIKIVFDAISSFTNTGSSARDLKDLAMHYLDNEHRYLQNEFIRFFVFPLIKECAKRYEIKRYDGRNEWACMACKELVDSNKQFFEDRVN